MVKHSEISFQYIRNKIRHLSKKELIWYTTELIRNADLRGEQIRLWDALILLKWSYLYAEEQHPIKSVDKKTYDLILKSIEKLQSVVFNKNVVDNNWDSFFQILTYQQFYLQEGVYWEDFARQICIYISIEGKYDIDKSFQSKTNLTILEFIEISMMVFGYVNSKKPNNEKQYNGYINIEDLPPYEQLFGKNNMIAYLTLLSISLRDAKEKINRYKKSLKNGTFQPFEVSVFTLYPFQLIANKLNIVHRDIFAHTCCHFIYDYLKENDPKFTTEFGGRFEKYIKLGLDESKAKYKTESNLRKEIGQSERVTDFIVEDFLLIECKGIEQKPIAGLNPFEGIAYKALKDSIIKAYSKQMLNVVLKAKTSTICYGLILTYKEFYYTSMDDLKELVENDINQFMLENNLETNPLPLENVFVIGVRAWDRLVQTIKDGLATFSEIMESVVKANSDDETKLKSFEKHLDKYKTSNWSLTYLKQSYALHEKSFDKRLKNGSN
ncbi:hypothetical protein [Zobellia nedashkovskayae]|uniref:hypothetical protein n=1 Tax=Zobellia nedashkovskayae TaxID=2779510 RepID=UPI00188BD005|nr:hypothetical protein [Zobellia nedashkovskayae]